jgi:myo-inositol 2-dehydrogenase/D-chiro-inositol 1-dehydrogenase
VVIVTTSSEHCWQIEAALDAGKHVFSEKPLGVDLVQCKQAEAAVERHPDRTFMLGFMRRYDKSYAYAKQKIEEGAIGTPYLVKATGIDPEVFVEGAIRFAPTSGGIFLDMGIHDIDLMRWFLGSEATEVYAMGATFKHPEFKAANDDETAIAMYKFANGAMGMVHVGRTSPYGYHVETEIVGTEGTIRISAVPEKNQAMVYNVHGACTECVGSFPERFAEAYLIEMEEFVNCALEGRKPGTSVYDGTKSTAIGYATTEAWKTGKIVKIG